MALLSVRRVLATTALLSPVLFASTASAQSAETAPAPAPAQSASVKIGTSDGKGMIYVDDKLVGEGSYVGELTAGTHKLKITREGYDPFEENLVVKANEPLARSVTLKLASTITTEQVKEERDRPEGLYGGFSLLYAFNPGGTGSSIQSECDAKGKQGSTIASCDSPDGGGPGVGGFFGYHWDPVGIEAYLAAHYDQRTLTRDQNAAVTDPGIGADPARHEEFKLRRVGGMALARVRLSWQVKRVRLGFVTGAGVSYRALSLERVTTAKDGSGARDLFVSNTPTYLSPVIAFEPTAMYRLTRGVAVSLGLQLFFERATSFFNEDPPQTANERNHSLGLRSLTTRPYTLATGMQTYIGPVIGMMFGP